MSKTKLLLDVVQDMNNLADSLKTLVQAMSEGETLEEKPVKKPEEAAPISLEEVRKVLSAASSAGKTAEVKALLNKYGTNKLSGIDPKDYAKILEEVKTI